MNIDLSQMTADLVAQEALLAAGDYEPAVQALTAMAADAEEYVDRNCPTTEQVQYFSFPSLFDRLAYRRVEHDPRTLKPVGEPLDRLYGDLAFGLVATGDYQGAMGALKHAVRWNPMGCGYRLDLAELYRIAGDVQEYLALTFSVFARASEVEHLLRAYVNFARWFGDTGRPDAEAACLACALRFETPYEPLDELVAADSRRSSCHGVCRCQPAGGSRGAARRRQRRHRGVPAHVRDRCGGPGRSGPRHPLYPQSPQPGGRGRLRPVAGSYPQLRDGS